jgi:hypothetical protein
MRQQGGRFTWRPPFKDHQSKGFLVELFFFGADLHRLHAGLGLSFRFKGAIVYDCRGCCGRLRIYDRALFGGGVAYNVKLGCARHLSGESRRGDERSSNKIFFQGFLHFFIVTQI